ncbi:MAG: caspase family protein [Pseudomonadales bacterium]|nr:caspase family protein [Pseudomonadales bacterium]
MAACLLVACGAIPGAAASVTADDLLVVDCALPGQIRQLGRSTTYVAPRQPVRTTAADCRERGGEYVVPGRADLGSALVVWMPQAQAGDAEAQTMVGELFERGRGIEPDYEAAALWYRRAADQGFARAQVNLGNLFERGLGVPRDPLQALAWYRRAAGLPDAVELESVPDVAPLLADRDRRIEALSGQIRQLEAESAALRAELEAARAALEAAESRADRADAGSAAADALRVELTRSTALLRERDAALTAQREAAAALLAELQAARPGPAADTTATAGTTAAEAGASDPGSAGLLAGPEISIIEPRTTGTRGLVRIDVAAAAASQQLVGRVHAPAGLLTLTVNGTPVTPNAAGVFSTPMPVGSVRTAVHVLAIDQQGKRADLELELAPAAAVNPSAVAAAPIIRGGYHALLIANNAYRHLPNLNSPIPDVERIDRILREQYGFSTRVLHNATRYDTLSALNELRARLTPDDNLLIYYAGHGELDQDNMRGHWLPVDAESDSTANWLSNVDVTDILNVIRARQVLLVVDSCYSGTLTRSSLTRLETGLTPEEQATWLHLMATKRARVVLTSGGLAPVLDFGGGVHSVFARAFIEALETNEDLLLGRSLYQAVAARVAHAAAGYDFEQIPQYAPISRAGHESGDFILQPRRPKHVQ